MHEHPHHPRRNHTRSLYACLLPLALLFALTSLATRSFAADVALTDLERYYVETNGEILLCVDPDWVPFESINERGEHQGIAADLLKLVSERTGLRFKLVQTQTWEESLDYSKSGKCQALSFLNETPKRKEWLVFSEPIFTDVNVFITREEHPFISDPGALTGETLVLPKGTAMEEFIRKDYPNLRIITVDTEAEAFQMISERKANMTMRSLIVAAYTIKKEGWFNLKISGQLPGYTNRLRVGLTKDKANLLDIINKGILSISGQDRGAIVDKHVSINVQTVTDYSLLYKVAGILLFVIAVAALWVRQLRAHNKELTLISQTDALTNVSNRLKLNTVLSYEFARAKRKWHPLSVLLIDLDHFKKVNDELGHIAGDTVLKEVSRILASQVRSIDVVGRWGGEEFLIICPDTDTPSAMIVAERIVHAVSQFTFTCNRSQTISIGVASLSENDTPDTLLNRADEALYIAKSDGRNCARAAFTCLDCLNQPQ